AVASTGVTRAMANKSPVPITRRARPDISAPISRTRCYGGAKRAAVATVVDRDISTLRVVMRRALAPLLVRPAQVTPLAGPGAAPGLVHARVPAARAALLGHVRCFASAVVGTPVPFDPDPFDPDPF